MVIWEAFTHEYKESMSSFVYCLTKQCAVEATELEMSSCGSFIASDDSANLNAMISQFGLEHQLDLEDT